jgi:hypothetical protein
MNIVTNTFSSARSAARSPFTRRGFLASLVFSGLSLTFSGDLLAEQHTGGVPLMSSRPGADYTIYLNVAGFNFDGLWHDHATAPGFTPALNDRLPTETFNATEQVQIQALWSRLAQSYSGFNVNVTTVDPAIAALGAGATDAQRQAWYDATPNLMHTVVGSQLRAPGTPGLTPGNKWFSDGADGVSPGIGVVAGIAPDVGGHTNWMFSEAQAGAATGGTINGDYIGAISAHENAHSFGLYHQGDWTGATLVNEYTNGDAAAGNGSYVATIGNASGRQRVAWRIGDTHPADIQTIQNDVRGMITTSSIAGSGGRAGALDLHLVDDGIGHTLGSATPLALNGSAVDSGLAQGIIVPNSEGNPQALGAANYTEDWFTFTLDGTSAISLTATDGTSFLQEGVADGVGTLRSTLSIYDFNGVLLANALEAPDTLTRTYSGNPGAGTFFAKVGSFGGHAQDSPDFNAASYFDMGAYFLSGSGFTPVPEPGSLVLLGMGALFTLRRRRSAAAPCAAVA